jgi:NAD+ synthase
MESLNLTADQLKSARKAVTSAIKGWVYESNTKGVVYGLSGGVDSALVCKLAAEAKVNAHALIMPETGLTPEQDVDDAVSLAKKLEVRYSILEINDVIDAVKETYGGKIDRISLGNVKARARMLYLYLTANAESRIVLGTSNKTELLTGYSTKHGDGAADFLPIGGLYKTQVRRLAGHVGIPKNILNKKPSAGLWRNQCDEDELGMDYRTLDRILYLMFEEWLEPSEVARKLNLWKTEVVRVWNRVDKNKHKLNRPEIAQPLF